MTNTNPTTNWHLSQMPNLIETLRQLSNAGVEIIGISTQNEPLFVSASSATTGRNAPSLNGPRPRSGS